MIAGDVSADNGREILSIDYEVAGFHPIMLDLAKPFYIDVFFDTVYMDVLPEVPETRCEIDGGLCQRSLRSACRWYHTGDIRCQATIPASATVRSCPEPWRRPGKERSLAVKMRYFCVPPLTRNYKNTSGRFHSKHGDRY